MILDTGVDLDSFLTEAICSYIRFLNGLPVSPTSHVICFGPSLHLKIDLVNVHDISLIHNMYICLV